MFLFVFCLVCGKTTAAAQTTTESPTTTQLATTTGPVSATQLPTPSTPNSTTARSIIYHTYSNLFIKLYSFCIDTCTSRFSQCTPIRSASTYTQVLQSTCERQTCSRSLRSNCLRRFCNPYSPRYRPSTLNNKSQCHRTGR